MAYKIYKNNGKVVTLLNPAEKAEKFASELKTGIRYTNDYQYKVDKNGDAGLTDVQRAYRSGYLSARSDSAKCYKAKNKKKA